MNASRVCSISYFERLEEGSGGSAVAIKYTSRNSAGGYNLEENCYLVSTLALPTEASYLYLRSSKRFCHLQLPGCLLHLIFPNTTP